MTKQIFVKVFNRYGDFIKVFRAAEFRGFTKTINEGLGECVVRLAQKFDYSGNETSLMNHVEVWISDADTVAATAALNMTTARRIYSGYLSMIEPSVSRGIEYIDLHLIGYQTLLGLDVLKSGTTTTVNTNATTGIGTSAAADADIGLVMRGIINRFIAETASTKIAWTADSVPLVTDDMRYAFEQMTYADAAAKARAAAPADYYTYLDADGLFHFKEVGAVAHEFVFGKHLADISIERSIERMRNVILVWDGLGSGDSIAYKQYQDTKSVETYGRRIERLRDSGIKTEATADLIGEKFIAENKDPIMTLSCDIIDNEDGVNGYDIESINPGDVCTFYNLGESISTLIKERAIITKVQYKLDRATITVEPIRTGVTDIQERLKKELKEISTTGIPTQYTT